MNRTLSLVTGAVVGAGLMFLSDPAHGARRRAVGRDRAKRLARARATQMGRMARHVGNRVRGRLAAAHARRDGHASDDVLVARVRSKIGHVVSHPHGIEIAAHDGHVTLAGHVLAQEQDPLLHTVSAVSGVADVDNKLTVHQSAEQILALAPRTSGESRRGALLAATILGSALVATCLAIKPRRCCEADADTLPSTGSDA